MTWKHLRSSYLFNLKISSRDRKCLSPKQMLFESLSSMTKWKQFWYKRQDFHIIKGRKTVSKIEKSLINETFMRKHRESIRHFFLSSWLCKGYQYFMNRGRNEMEEKWLSMWVFLSASGRSDKHLLLVIIEQDIQINLYPFLSTRDVDRTLIFILMMVCAS